MSKRATVAAMFLTLLFLTGALLSAWAAFHAEGRDVMLYAAMSVGAACMAAYGSKDVRVALAALAPAPVVEGGVYESPVIDGTILHAYVDRIYEKRGCTLVRYRVHNIDRPSPSDYPTEISISTFQNVFSKRIR